jgi:cobalamin-dependent methionine synthase I
MNYKIDKNIVLNYLGHKDQFIDDKLNNIIDEIILNAVEYIKPASVYGIFDIKINEDNIIFDNKFTVSSKDLFQLLKFSEKAVLIAFTIGSLIEQKIKFLSYTDVTKAVILDCCAAAAIENYADNVLNKILEKLRNDCLNLTNRFSAGYGDFSLNHQTDIINILDTRRRIGLYTDNNSLLYPKKSITAVVGIIDKEIQHSYYAGCENCAARNNCTYRKAGKHCVSS